MTATGYLKRLTRRLTEDLDKLDAEGISDDSRAAGATPASECCRGDDVVMYGELRSVQTCSKTAKAGVVAEFFDGTDVVMLKWIGQNRIPGIEPTKRITVRGRIGEKDGTKVIYNPYYEILGED